MELALASPVVLYCGFPFFVRAVASVRNRAPNMWTLIGLGVAAAYAYSVIATVAPGVFPESMRQDGQVMVYFEAASVIVTLTLLGQVLELRARASTAEAIKGLLGLAPKTARRIGPDGSEPDVDLAEVMVGGCSDRAAVSDQACGARDAAAPAAALNSPGFGPALGRPPLDRARGPRVPSAGLCRVAD